MGKWSKFINFESEVKCEACVCFGGIRFWAVWMWMTCHYALLFRKQCYDRQCSTESSYDLGFLFCIQFLEWKPWINMICKFTVLEKYCYVRLYCMSFNIKLDMCSFLVSMMCPLSLRGWWHFVCVCDSCELLECLLLSFATFGSNGTERNLYPCVLQTCIDWWATQWMKQRATACTPPSHSHC